MAKHLDQPVDRYPLAWPLGSPRTQKDARRNGQFKSRDRRQIEVGPALTRVVTELERLGAEPGTPVLSSNVPVGLAGLAGSTPTNGDPGVAIYFRHAGKPIVFACDTYLRVADNIAAIGNHIEAIRAIERYGVGRLEQVLVGFQRQLTGRRAWFDVLEVKSDATDAVVEANYKRLAKDWHPDKPGGSTEKMTELNEAYQQVQRERGR